MKRIATQSTELSAPTNAIARKHRHRRSSYQRVCDERKRPIRGLWVRNLRYYAQLTLEDETTGQKRVRRVPLEKATTPSQAKKALEDLLVGRRKGALPMLKRTPKFAVFAEEYRTHYQTVKDAKKASTVKTEGYAIDRWKEHLGHVRLDKINRKLIDSYIAKRQGAKKSARTVNLEVIVLRNVLKKAIDDKWISRLPTENLRPLKSTPRKRALTKAGEIERLCSVGFEPIFANGRLAKEGETGRPLQNAQRFCDYIQLLCYSGARMSEALRLRWSDVDGQNRQLTIGSDGEAKNRKWRAVEFNSRLEALLKDMEQRRAPDSEWVFPSPRRGEEDKRAKTFRESLVLARAAAGLHKFGFHDCRHYFISMAVMAGIDYMTIARWVGHQDGGVLIGKVYGHLSNEHAELQARKLDLSPQLPTVSQKANNDAGKVVAETGLSSPKE